MTARFLARHNIGYGRLIVLSLASAFLALSLLGMFTDEGTGAGKDGQMTPGVVTPQTVAPAVPASIEETP